MKILFRSATFGENPHVSKRVITILTIVFLPFVAKTQSLHHYWWLYDRSHISEFENTRFAFDTDGVITNNKAYHPSTISVFGLLSLNEFEQTGDSIHFFNFTNQVKYFTDTSKTHALFDGKGLGLPYNFSYHGLEPPWYSGLGQGYALSFLLRYHAYSGNDKVLPIIHKIAYLFLRDEQEQGVLSKTREGYLWIEEYPMCPKARHVFNGFLVALFGLGDYCDYFPEKTEFRAVHTEAMASLKTLLRQYDAPEWALYSRSNTKRCTPAYMLAEIFQVKYLYDLTNDTLFLNQTMLWSAHMGLRPVRDSAYCYVHPNFRFSIPLNVDYDSLGIAHFRNTYDFPGGDYQKPAFVHYKSKAFSVVQGKPVYLEIPQTTGQQPTIFVRYGSKYGTLIREKYHADQLVKDQFVIAPSTGVAEVILVYPLENYTKIEGKFEAIPP